MSHFSIEYFYIFIDEIVNKVKSFNTIGNLLKS